MITGTLKNKINAIWQDFYNENMAQTSDIVNQLTTLMFIKMLDDKQNARATKVNYLGQDAEGNDKVDKPSSAADTYMKWEDGKFYYSNAGSLAGNKNKTMELGTPMGPYEDFNNINMYPGNKPRTDMARVRCVRKM